MFCLVFRGFGVGGFGGLGVSGFQGFWVFVRGSGV